MGVFERDYMRPEFRSGSRSSGPRSWSIVVWLIVINVVVYTLPRFFSDADGSLVYSLESFGSLSWQQLKAGKVWTPVTYMFLHGSLMHLAGNMFVLFFAGRNVLALLGKRHFLTIYFAGGILGGLLQVAFGALVGDNPLIGASGGVVALLIAMAALIPEQVVYLLLFFVIPVKMKMKTVALLVVAIDVAMLIGETLGVLDLGIGNLAHLGGALCGWLYIKRGLSTSRSGSATEADRWMKRFGRDHVVDAEVVEPTEKKTSWFQVAKKQSYISPSVDEILEKISAHGMQSLTDEDRQVLEKNSDELARMTKRADNK